MLQLLSSRWFSLRTLCDSRSLWLTEKRRASKITSAVFTWTALYVSSALVLGHGVVRGIARCWECPSPSGRRYILWEWYIERLGFVLTWLRRAVTDTSPAGSKRWDWPTICNLSFRQTETNRIFFCEIVRIDPPNVSTIIYKYFRNMFVLQSLLGIGFTCESICAINIW